MKERRYKFILKEIGTKIRENKLYDESRDITSEEISQVVIKKYRPFAEKILNSDKHIDSVTLEIKCESLSDLFEF